MTDTSTRAQHGAALPDPALTTRLPGRELPPVARRLMALLLVLVTVGVYQPALEGQWVWDDVRLVDQTPDHQSWSTLSASLKEPHWAFDRNPNIDEVGYWRPLTKLVLGVPRVLGSHDPFWHHALSLLVHLMATWMAFRLVRRLSRHDGFAFACAALFALHPVQVQSVGWISSINDPLAGLFLLGAIDAFVRWRQAGSRGIPLATSLYLALALASKELGLVGLPLLLLVDATACRFGGAGPGRFGRLLRAHAPLVVVLVVYLGLRYTVFHSDAEDAGGGGLSALLRDLGLGGSVTAFGLEHARAVQLRFEMFGTWLSALVWPAELPFFRNVWLEIPAGDPRWRHAQWMLALFALVAVVAAVRRSGRLALALGAILIVLSPTLVNHEGAGAWPVTDRALYLAVVPFAALVIGAATRWLPSAAGAGAVALLLGWCGARTLDQAAAYTDNEAFFRRAVVESPRVAEAHNQLGRILLERYRISPDNVLVDEALLHFLISLTIGHDYGEQGLQLGPDHELQARLAEAQQLIHMSQLQPRPSPHEIVSGFERVQGNVGQGWCYLHNAEANPDTSYADAENVFRQVVEHAPYSSEAWEGLAASLSLQGRYDEAHQAFGNAARLDPYSGRVRHGMAVNLSLQGKVDEARRVAEEALVREPNNEKALFLIAKSFVDTDQPERARGAIEGLREIDPRNPALPYLEGFIEFKRSNWPGALARFDQCLALEPDYADAYLTKGLCHVQLDQRELAIQALGRACELKPTSFEAHYNLAALLLQDPATAASAENYLLVAYRYSPRGQSRTVLREAIRPFVDGQPDRLMGLATLDQSRADPHAALYWSEGILAVTLPWPNVPQAVRQKRLAAVRRKRGALFGQLGDSQRSIAEYEQARSLDPTDFWTQHNLAMVYMARDVQRPDLALPLIEGALEGLDAVPPSGRMAVEATLEALRDQAQQALNQVGPPVPLDD